MPASYLSKHRPICSVLEQILELAKARGDEEIVDLIEEAIPYAKSMSNKLSEYKEMKDTIAAAISKNNK